MSGYITIPTVTDPDLLATDALTYLQTNIPGYVPHDGNLDVWLINALSRMLATSRDVASAVPQSIFKWFGSTVAGLPPLPAAAATLNATFNVKDNAGYTIPQGTMVAGIPPSGTDYMAFETEADAVVPPGSTSITGVICNAVTPGSASNGVPTGPLILVNPISFITGVTGLTVSSGGADEESDAAYLGRLVAELQLIAPRPIVPNDFAVMAENVAGVFRALAVDGYDPAGGGTYGNERTIAIAAVDNTGAGVSSTVKAAIQAYLQARREVNFVVNTIDPTSTTVNVSFQAHVLGPYTAATVIANAVTAIQNYLSPSTWGGGGQTPPVWLPSSTVRLNRIIQVIEDTVGVDYVPAGSVLLNGVAADLALTGAAPLPAIGTITGTAV